MMLKIGTNALDRENSMDFTITTVVDGTVVDFVNTVDLSKLGDNCCMFHEALDYMADLDEAKIKLMETMNKDRIIN